VCVADNTWVLPGHSVKIAHPEFGTATRDQTLEDLVLSLSWSLFQVFAEWESTDCDPGLPSSSPRRPTCRSQLYAVFVIPLASVVIPRGGSGLDSVELPSRIWPQHHRRSHPNPPTSTCLRTLPPHVFCFFIDSTEKEYTYSDHRCWSPYGMKVWFPGAFESWRYLAQAEVPANIPCLTRSLEDD